MPFNIAELTESKTNQAGVNNTGERMFEDAYSKPQSPDSHSKSDSSVKQNGNEGSDGSSNNGTLDIPKIQGYDI